MKLHALIRSFALTVLVAAAAPLFADTGTLRTPQINDLQSRWAHVNYDLDGKEQVAAFRQLIDEAQSAIDADPESAPVWIWSGIIKSTYAGVAGPMDALKFAKSAKADLEHALEIDPDALDGSAYTSLGALYYNVPGWPIGFGDDGRAEELLKKALAINPDGIDSNYFYGDYLVSEKRYAEAEEFLVRAQNSPPRPDRPLADEGRQREIALALTSVRKKLEP